MDAYDSLMNEAPDHHGRIEILWESCESFFAAAFGVLVVAALALTGLGVL
jgi:hypothetical protein